MAQPTIRTRLCPHCANSIAADALKCPYCKANLRPEPQWPEREEPVKEKAARPEGRQLTARSMTIMVLGLLLFALGVYLVGGQQERSDLEPALAQAKKEALEKDEKITRLEEQLAQSTQRTEIARNEIEQLKAKLAASQKELAAQKKQLAADQTELAAARKRLTDASREIERLAAARAAPAPRVAEAPTPPARRAVESGLYETVRPTTVFEQPASSSRIVSRISKGVQVNAVRSVGDWLEIRSKQGNPPGYIRADDATLISRGN